MSDKHLAQTISDLEARRHSWALGVVRLPTQARIAEMELPPAPHLLWDSATGQIANGAILTLLDTCCAAAAQAHPAVQARSVTLDLRVDYVRPAFGHLYARAETYALEGDCAFVEAIVHEGDFSAPVARATATFVIARV